MATSQCKLSFLGGRENTATDQSNECALHLSSHTWFSLPSTWKNDRARKIALTDLKFAHQSPVCQLCCDDIGRLVKGPQITPRWEKAKTEKKCCVPMCNSACFCLSKFATSEQTAHILKCETVPYPTPLEKDALA